MTDIQELCRRVIIIDHGAIFFDGQLSEVVDRFADSELITLQCPLTVDLTAAPLAQYGEVVQQAAGTVQLKVKRDRVIPVCKALLDQFPVQDIDIQEVPVEEVIRHLFAARG